MALISSSDIISTKDRISTPPDLVLVFTERGASVEERIALIKESLGKIENIEICVFKGLLVDFVKEQGAGVIIRGLRAVSDYEYEAQIAMTNRRLDESIETVFLLTSREYSFISSRLVREIASLGGDVSSFVTPNVEKSLKEKQS